MNKFLLSFLIVLPALANAGELTLPGERWQAKFDKFICQAFGESVTRPQALETLNAQFERLTTDSTLDNVLLRATYEDAGVACRYNALLFADNQTQTYSLVQSVGYSPENEQNVQACAAGKAVLDAALAGNKYLYYGHPHNVALLMTGVGSEAVCGADASVMGANFVVTGIINK